MPRIVSGIDPQGNLNAYLAGRSSEVQRQQMKQQAEAQANARAMQYQQMAKEAALKHKQEQGRALEDANRRAQMGDAQAMEQQNMEARAQGQPPEQKRLQEMSGILSRISDPDARDFARKEFMGYEKQLRDEEQKRAAMSMIDTSVKDGHMDQADVQARMDAGEEPEQIAKEAAKIRQDRVKANVAMEDAQEAIAQAQQILQTAQKGSKGASLAKNALSYFMDSPTAQQTPGGGAKMLKTVKDALVRGHDKEIEAAAQEKLEAFKEDAGKEPRPLYGEWAGDYGGPMVGGPKGPEGPTPGTHATVRRFEKLKRDLRKTVIEIGNQTDDDAEFAAMLKAAGVPLTSETQAAVRAIIQEEEASLGGAAE